jgi:SPP1 gp7 family putative phage head morphogenesis protein
MNSEQLRLFINGAFGNEADARKLKARLDPVLRRLLEQIRTSIENLPDESLARQREWRLILEQFDQLIEPYNDAFAIELSRQLPLSGAAAAEETTLMLKSVVPRTAGLVPSAAIMADSTKFLLNTKVNERRVLGFFIPEERGKASPFTKSVRRRVNQIVTGGIIRGDSTAKIAGDLPAQLKKQLEGDEMAFARTAIQDYNRQVKEQVWSANRDAFARLGLKYEWVAALDSRTCPTCAPLDGDVRDAKGDFPKTPVHVNCRCQVVLVDPEDPGKIRYGQVISDRPLSGKGTYKTQKRINGKDWNRQNRQVDLRDDGKSPRYADWLAQMAEKQDPASIDTLREFFGGGDAGNTRADNFRKDVRKGVDPAAALVKQTNRVDRSAKRTTRKGVARRFVSNK